MQTDKCETYFKNKLMINLRSKSCVCLSGLLVLLERNKYRLCNAKLIENNRMCKYTY